MEGMNQSAQQAREYGTSDGAGIVTGAGSMLGERATSPGNVGNQKRRIGFDFGLALARVKDGQRMSRHGWNGPGQFIYIEAGSDPSDPYERSGLLSGIRSSLFAFGDRGTTRRLPHVCLHNTRGESVPWLPSQSDMLAEDWYQV